ncbi:glycosyltransferase family 2 protein [Pseudobdellovibrio sp. HCB154]|uniref:glycosyltransferase family 2 protein n=1 Tax=Pseudobdellovibrio sp. HCB154 TaxID=3386277 RepID=UPI0039171CD0
MANPLLSIVIPTRNRQHYAYLFIKSLLGTKESFELIVNDNSDTKELEEKLTPYKSDSRLNYSYSSEVLSVVENFNSGLSKTTGEYVVFVGDDDFISFRIFDFVRDLKSKEIDTVVFGRKNSVLHYFWPGVKAAQWGDVGGHIYFSDFHGKLQFLDKKSISDFAIEHLGTGPREMPRAYLGIISRNVINKVTEKYGFVFGGVSPDVYSSHLICDVARNVLRYDFPMIIPGAAAASTSAQRAERSDVGGDLKKNDHTGRFKNIDWNMKIPKYYAPFTVWALSLFQATLLTKTKVSEKAYAHLYAQCLLFARGHTAEVKKAMKHDRSTIGFLVISILTGFKMAEILTHFVLSKSLVFIRQKPGGAKYGLEGFENIEMAVSAMENQLKLNT